MEGINAEIVGAPCGGLCDFFLCLVVSFLVSLLVIRGLMEYVRRHSFSAFGVYRIILGVVVLVYFALAG